MTTGVEFFFKTDDFWSLKKKGKKKTPYQSLPRDKIKICRR